MNRRNGDRPQHTAAGSVCRSSFERKTLADCQQNFNFHAYQCAGQRRCHGTLACDGGSRWPFNLLPFKVRRPLRWTGNALTFDALKMALNSRQKGDRRRSEIVFDVK